MARQDIQEQLALWDELGELQDTFPNNVHGLLSFASMCLAELIPGSPKLNRIQADILKFMLEGNKYRMVQAQRGQAKTTLAGIFCAFQLIHNPHYRVVIFSQTGKRAKEISGWVVKIFTRIEVLHFMLPDRQAGDKSSATEGFDIKGILKGAGKEPSITCYSIEAGAQGARADIILADDIESLQNSRTVTGREWLEEQSREFSSINQYGDIIYLGTPQSTESIYNNLPSRGYEVRIWTGRYPTEKELHSYGDYLAPIIRRDLERDSTLQSGGGLTGDRGQPTCPEMYHEELLVEKEIELGAAKFNLQFMLNTRLSDADRYPLKLCNLTVAPMSLKQGIVLPVWSDGLTSRVKDAPRVGNKDTDYFNNLYPREYDWRDWDRKIMFIDPAGGGANGDETAYAVLFVLGNMVYLYDVGGVHGGYAPDSMEALVAVAKECGVREVFIEDNYGKGALQAVIEPYFHRSPELGGWNASITPVCNSGQKEVRIIDTVQPFLDSHRLIVKDSLLKKDQDSTLKYSIEKRKTYSLFFQLAHITRDKGCLGHDDRADALAGALAQVAERIAFDQTTRDTQIEREALREWLAAQRDPSRRRELFSPAAQPSYGRRGNAFAGLLKDV